MAINTKNLKITQRHFCHLYITKFNKIQAFVLNRTSSIISCKRLMKSLNLSQPWQYRKLELAVTKTPHLISFRTWLEQLSPWFISR